ncbi:MAG: cysteine peptidase family C39 domain-containing protein [Pseudomonadota bacterium]
MMFRRARTPMILQMEATECGAASLAMVLGHHGCHVPLEDVRARCATSRDGISAANLVRAARSYNLEARAYARDPGELKQLPMPQILYWAFNHFVVLEAVHGGRFVILDPAIGRRVIGPEEMSRDFTGVTLALTPTLDFVRGGQRPSVVHALVSEARRSPDALIIMAITGLMSVIPGLAFSGASQVFIDQVLGEHQTDWLPVLLAALLAIACVQAMIGLLDSRMVAAWKAKIGAVQAGRSFWHALRLPLSFFAQRSAGEVVSRLRIGSEVGATIAGPLAQSGPLAVTAGIYLGFLAIHNGPIAGCVAAVAALNLALMTHLARRVSDRNREEQVTRARAGGVAIAGLSAIGAYETLGRRDHLVAQWAAAEDAALNAEQRLGLLHAVSSVAPVVSGLLISGVVLGVGTLEVTSGQLTLGGLIAAQLIGALVNTPLAKLAHNICELHDASGALMRLTDLEAHAVDPAFAPRQAKPNACLSAASAAGPNGLSLSGVTYGHAPERPVLYDIDLHLPPGRLTAVLGTSGAGKSTLARLAAGLVQPWHGDVSFNGRSLTDYDQDALRKQMIYVGQDTAIFSGSIAENIAMFDGEMTDEVIASAAQQAHVHAAIVRHRAGYGTQLSFQTGGLSRGERQRLSLARALARRPAVLVLDEITSGLDLMSEHDVMASLRESVAAVLIVTHRRGTALNCDDAIWLNDGRIVQRGHPADILAAGVTHVPEEANPCDGDAAAPRVGASLMQGVA